MKSIAEFMGANWHLILMALTSGGLLLWPLVRQGAGGAGSVGTTEAVRLINREKGVLVDVSEPNEFAASHAAGARNLPLGQMEGAKELPTNKQLPILLMCPSGARAGRAATLLRKAGYEKAAAVAGGTKAWSEAQLPMARLADKADSPSA